jgi:hypothetical protein
MFVIYGETSHLQSDIIHVFRRFCDAYKHCWISISEYPFSNVILLGIATCKRFSTRPFEETYWILNMKRSHESTASLDRGHFYTGICFFGKDTASSLWNGYLVMLQTPDVRPKIPFQTNVLRDIPKLEGITVQWLFDVIKHISMISALFRHWIFSRCWTVDIFFLCYTRTAQISIPIIISQSRSNYSINCSNIGRNIQSFITLWTNVTLRQWNTYCSRRSNS